MALDHDEMNRRRQERELRRQQALQEQRKLIVKLILAAAVILVCGVGIFLLARGAANRTPQGEAPAESDTKPVVQATTPTKSNSIFNQEPTTVIHIRAGGDLNITDAVVNAGLNVNGYDYTAAFRDVAPLLSDADLTMLNFEGNLCGTPYGSVTTSAPQELVEALRAAGVDILQAANSCTVNNGLLGMQSTINGIRAAGIEPVGAYATPQEFRQSKGYTICNIRGIKIAVVAFTKGVGSGGIPASGEECINLLYTDYATTYQKVDKDFINQVMRDVNAEDPDITIAMLHWGSEFNDSIADSQKTIVSLLQKRGVDVILGTHPHLVHEISYDEKTGNLVAYSLGDFFGDAKKGGTNYSIILDLEITMDNETGKTRVTNFSYIPIYTLSEAECDGQRRVVRIAEAMQAYESNYVDSITTAAYKSMENALLRIEDRVCPDWKCGTCGNKNTVSRDICEKCGGSRTSK